MDGYAGGVIEERFLPCGLAIVDFLYSHAVL